MPAPSEEDFARLVRESSGRLLAVSRRILGDASDAEEALQEAFLAAWRSRRTFDERSKLSTWMHRIVVNAALNRWKQRSARARRVVVESNTVETAAIPDPRGRDATRELVGDAIDRLPEEQRVVLVLCDVEQYTAVEAAAQLELSHAAVRQRLHRARKQVAERLAPDLCGADGMTCGGQLDLLLDRIDGMLTGEMLDAVSDHVASCPACTRFDAGYRETIAAARESLGPDPATPPWWVDRLLPMLRAEANAVEAPEGRA